MKTPVMKSHSYPLKYQFDFNSISFQYGNVQPTVGKCDQEEDEGPEECGPKEEEDLRH